MPSAINHQPTAKVDQGFLRETSASLRLRGEEILQLAEVLRIPKHEQAETAHAKTLPSSQGNVAVCLTRGSPSRFGFRDSDFFRHSDFDIRHCPSRVLQFHRATKPSGNEAEDATVIDAPILND